MYDLQPYLNTIEDVIAQGPSRIPGSPYPPIRCRTGIRTPNLVFSFTGAFTAFLPLETNGIRVTCISKERRNMSITSRPTGDITEFGYKDFIPMFKGERFDRRRNGWICFSKQGKIRSAGGGAS